MTAEAAIILFATAMVAALLWALVQVRVVGQLMNRGSDHV